MLAIYDEQDRLTDQVRDRLLTTGMGLGLVRLLLDAGQTNEARSTLSLLENGPPDGNSGMKQSNRDVGKKNKSRFAASKRRTTDFVSN